MQDKAGQHLIGTKAAQGRQQQGHVFLALRVAPEAVVGMEQQLKQYGASIQQQQMWYQLALSHGICHSIAQGEPGQHNGHKNQNKAVTQKQDLLSEVLHNGKTASLSHRSNCNGIPSQPV